MSVTPRDLQEMFDELLNGKPASVLAAAQYVGGKVIAGTPAVTRNARAMTALLGGGGNGHAPLGPGSPTMPSLAAAANGHDPSAPTGSKSKPFTIELAQTSIQNLAKQIGQEKKGQDEKQTALQRFLGKFGEGWSKGRDAARRFDPLYRLGQWSGEKVKGRFSKWFGGGKAEEKPAEAEEKQSFLDLAKKIAERNAKARGGRKLNLKQDPLSEFGDTHKLNAEAGQANRAGRLAGKDVYGVEGEGFSSNLKAPRGVPATPAAGEISAETGLAATTGAEAAEGGLAALGAAAGTVTGGVLVAVAAYAVFVTAVYGAAKAVQAFGQAQVEGYREFKRFNGSLAVMFNQVDRQKLLLDARTAANTGGTAKMMGEQQMQLNENLQGLSEDLANIKNTAVTGLLWVANRLVEALKVIEVPIHWIAEFCKSLNDTGSDKLPPIARMFDQMGHGRATNGYTGFKVQRPGGH